MNRRLTAFVALATWGTAFAGEQTEFAVPVIGHVYDAALHQVRPVAGTPGAATVRTGVVLPDAEKALVAADGSIALVSSSKGEALRVIRSNGESHSIPDTPPLFDKGRLSAGATSALLYATACNCVRIVSGLRETPAIRRTIPLPEGSDVRALSVNDAATVAAVAIRIGGGSKVLVYAGGADVPSAEVDMWADAIALDAAGERLLVVETALRKAHIVSNLATSPAVDEIVTERDGLASPAAAAFAANGIVLVADTEAGIILWREADRTARRVECACKPQLVEPTGNPGVYRLSNLEHGAVWFLDAASELPRTFFVPAPRTEAAQ